MDIEKAKDKVAKLMAMATDGRGNEFEAEAALRQAEALMRKHGIDAAQLADRTSTKPVFNWIRRHVPAGAPVPVYEFPVWFGFLTLGIAKFTDCKVEITYPEEGKYGRCAAFSGDEMDVEYAVYLTKHLRDDCRRQAAKFHGTRAERVAFRKAYAIRMQDRMAVLRAERNKALEAAKTSTGTALVVVQTKIAERDAKFGAQKVRNRSVGFRTSTLGAVNAGKKAADAASIHRPLSSNNARKQISA